mmetsp:Transcript_34323/g.85536  ORF Transcript_34323/g.85536 Transcript_34323/m.85536 type:complete len:213 (+) Transcript_34323:232-870(+)
MPHVENKHKTSFAPVVPRLVLEGVVKDQRTPHLRRVHRFSHPHARAADTRQRQMNPQFLIRGAVVPYDVRARSECGEEGVVVGAGHCIEQLDRDRTQQPIALKFDLVKREIKDVPIASVVTQLTVSVGRIYGIFRGPRGYAQRLKALLTPQREQLAPDLIGFLLEGPQPRERTRVPYRLCAQLGEQLGAARLPGRFRLAAGSAVDQVENPRP